MFFTQASFRNLETWLTEIERHGRPDVIRVLVGNKCDLDSQRKVTYEQGEVGFVEKAVIILHWHHLVLVNFYVW